MVEVRLMQRLGNRTQYYEVLVQSNARPQVKLRGILERPTTAKQVGLLAGALAEELDERYSDTLDPSTIANAALEAYRELILDNPEPSGVGDELPREADAYIKAGLERHR